MLPRCFVAGRVANAGIGTWIVVLVGVLLATQSVAGVAARHSDTRASAVHECVECSVCAALALEMQAVLQNGPLQEPSSSPWLQASDLPTSELHLIVGRWTPYVVRSRRVLGDAVHLVSRLLHHAWRLLGAAYTGGADDDDGDAAVRRRVDEHEAVSAAFDELSRSLERRGLRSCLSPADDELLRSFEAALTKLVPPQWWLDAQCGPLVEGDVDRAHHPFSPDAAACLRGSSAVVRAAADSVARSHRWPAQASMARLGFVGRKFASAQAATVRDRNVQAAVARLLTPARNILLQAAGNTLRTVRSGAVSLLESEEVLQLALQLTAAGGRDRHGRDEWHRALRSASLDALGVSSCSSWCAQAPSCFRRLFPGNSVVNLTSPSPERLAGPETKQDLTLYRVAVHAVLVLQLAHVKALM